MLNMNIQDATGVKNAKNEFGIEIEAEFDQAFLYNVGDYKGWRVENDGSLKGFGLEFVTTGTVNREMASARIKVLRQKLAEQGAKITDSMRAGVHVHVNMQKYSIQDLFKILAVYYPLENLITKFCGDCREGNLFCLRASDSYVIPQSLTMALEKGDFHCLRTDSLRYSALNLQPLFKYGSIEFRALRTDPKLSNIEPWIDLIKTVIDYALKQEDLGRIPEIISGNGPILWAKEVLGEEWLEKLIYPEAEDEIIENIRDFQMFYYALRRKGV